VSFTPSTAAAPLHAQLRRLAEGGADFANYEEGTLTRLLAGAARPVQGLLVGRLHASMKMCVGTGRHAAPLRLADGAAFEIAAPVNSREQQPEFAARAAAAHTQTRWAATASP
jgi:hypothetical protein